MTTEPESIYYGTFFDHAHCGHPTRSGKVCQIAPQWVNRSTGQLLCYVHAPMEFNRLKGLLLEKMAHDLRVAYLDEPTIREPESTPLVVAGIYGGIVQWTLTLPGNGMPVSDVLDFDREGEDDENRLEWLEYADEVVDRIEARRDDIEDEHFDVDALRASLDNMRPKEEER